MEVNHLSRCPLCAGKTSRVSKKTGARKCGSCEWRGKSKEQASFPQWVVSSHKHADLPDFYLWMSSVKGVGLGIQYFGIEQPNGTVIGYVFAPNEHHVHRGRKLDKGQRVFLTGNLNIDYGGNDGK